METRWLRDIPRVDIEHAMAGFYVLEELELMYQQAMRHQLARILRLPKHSWSANPDAPTVIDTRWQYQMDAADVIEQWGTGIRRARYEYQDTLAEMLHDYLVVIAFGEARHAPGCIELQIPEIDGEANRNIVIQAALQYNPLQALTVLRDLFLSDKWGNSYGGKAWANICEAALMFYTERPVVFIDHVADLSHNGSVCFDKRVLFNMDRDDYRRMLDKKYTGSLLDSDVLCVPMPIGGLVRNMPPSIQRPGVRLVDVGRLEYTPLKFGTATLSAPVEYKRPRSNRRPQYSRRRFMYNEHCSCDTCKSVKEGNSPCDLCLCSLCLKHHVEPTSSGANWWPLQFTDGVWKYKKTCKCQLCKFYAECGKMPCASIMDDDVRGHKWGWDAGKTLSEVWMGIHGSSN